jgi:hypothetical protein
MFAWAKSLGGVIEIGEGGGSTQPCPSVIVEFILMILKFKIWMKIVNNDGTGKLTSGAVNAGREHYHPWGSTGAECSWLAGRHVLQLHGQIAEPITLSIARGAGSN